MNGETTVSVIETQQRLEPDRRTFDETLADLMEVDPKIIRANALGKQIAELAARADGHAKEFIRRVEDEFKPAIDRATQALREVRAIKDRILDTPVKVRDVSRRLLAQYELAVREKVEVERRELEQRQREAEEKERQARLEELRRQEEEQRRAAEAAQDELRRQEAEREAQRLAQEQADEAARPLAPVAVPAAALGRPRRVEGVGGTTVYLRQVEAHGAFFQWLAGQEASIEQQPQGKRNMSRIRLAAGIEIEVNFSGLRNRSEQVRIPGVMVSKTVDVANRRR